MRVQVAAAQVALGKGSYRKAVDDAIGLIREAKKLGAKIVCLPEHWLLEYREQGYGAIKVLADVAREEQIFIVTGANYFPIDESKSSGTCIRSHLVGPDGQPIGKQDKIHLFRDEKDVATPGKSCEVFDTPLGKLGIIVCYDNVFPEVCRMLVLKDADLVFVPSRIVMEGLDSWILYLRTRALENRVPIVAPNVFHPSRYVGGSVIIDLDVEDSTRVVIPKIVEFAKSGERVIVADVDLERARGLRKERLSDRRPSVYEGLS